MGVRGEKGFIGGQIGGFGGGEVGTGCVAGRGAESGVGWGEGGGHGFRVKGGGMVVTLVGFRGLGSKGRREGGFTLSVGQGLRPSLLLPTNSIHLACASNQLHPPCLCFQPTPTNLPVLPTNSTTLPPCAPTADARGDLWKRRQGVACRHTEVGHAWHAGTQR